MVLLVGSELIPSLRGYFFSAAEHDFQEDLCSRVWLVVKNALSVLLYFASCCLIDWRVTVPLFWDQEGFHVLEDVDLLEDELEEAISDIEGSELWKGGISLDAVAEVLREASECDYTLEWRLSFDLQSLTLVLSLYAPLGIDLERLPSFEEDASVGLSVSDWEETSVLVDPEKKKKLSCLQTLLSFKVS